MLPVVVLGRSSSTAAEDAVKTVETILRDDSLGASARLKAAVVLRDRAGFTTKTGLEIGVTVEAWEELLGDGLAFTDEDTGGVAVAYVHDCSSREHPVVNGDGVGVDDRDPNGGSDGASVGVARLPRVTDASSRGLHLAGGATALGRAVVWATGYRPDFAWLGEELLDRSGWPSHRSGMSTAEPRIGFVGLPLQRSITSHLLGGVDVDAAHVARRLWARPSPRR